MIFEFEIESTTLMANVLEKTSPESEIESTTLITNVLENQLEWIFCLQNYLKVAVRIHGDERIQKI